MIAKHDQKSLKSLKKERTMNETGHFQFNIKRA